MAKKQNPISKHPEAAYNGRGYFNFETNRIPEEVVPRGDVYQVHPDPYDLTPKDLTGIAAYAVSLIDNRIYDIDPEAGIEDAMLMSIRSKDSGKYDGLVSYNTGLVIAEIMKELLSKNSKKASKEDSEDLDTAKEGKKDKEVSIQAPGPNVSIKKDRITKKPGTGGKVLQVDLGGGSAKERMKNQRVLKMLTKKASEELDIISSELENSDDPELKKLAYELDVIANTLESEFLEG